MGIIKESLYKIAAKGVLPAFKNRSVFPYYHLVRDKKVAHIEHLYPYKNVAQFRRDLDLLLQNYKPIDPADLLKNTQTENGFLLTFDDGLSEIYTVIFPILQEKDIKAVFLVNPDFVDNHESLYKHDISLIIGLLEQHNFDGSIVSKICSHMQITDNPNRETLAKRLKATPFSERQKIKELCILLGIDVAKYLESQKPYITKAQIAEMLAAGHYFGGHTLSHPPLIQLTHEQQKAEIIGSIEWVKSNFGIPYALFAFPFSDKGISAKLLNELFAYDPKLLLFGNSGIKRDVNERIIQRFSLENPSREPAKLIVAENLYRLYNKIIGQYKIKRR
jgi:peptidoglycan/xylan/chitin deacetylase (PgdA/CDA1 family)